MNHVILNNNNNNNNNSQKRILKTSILSYISLIVYFLSSFIADIFSVGIWKDFASLPDHLKPLTTKIKQLCCLQEFQANYTGAFRRWKTWATENNISYFPVDPIPFSLYLSYLMDSRGSYHSVKEAIYAADWVQKIAGLQTISSCPIIDQIQSGSHRILGRPTIKKDPVTSDMLRHLVLKLPSNPSLKEVRSVSLCLTGYAGFLRFDELSSILCCDIKILDSHLKLFLEKSKAEQFRDGHWIPISRTGKITCPVDALISYIKVGGIDLKGALPVYRAINSAKNAKTPLQRRGLSYTRVRELVLECFIDFPKVNIGVHSLTLFSMGGAIMAPPQFFFNISRTTWAKTIKFSDF